MPASEHKLGLRIERAQECSLPIVPNAWPHRANIADGENEQHFEAFECLHAIGEVRNGGSIAEITPLSLPVVE